MLDLISQMKVSDLALKFLRGDLRHIAAYPFAPQKKEFAPVPGFGGLPHSTPEAQGVPSEHIRRFFEELDRCTDVRVHSVLILRHGRVIAEGSFQPYSSAYPHMMFSMSKSVTGMAAGMAVRDGLLSLDEKIVDIFPEKLSLLRSSRVNNITVLHLLNMTSGIKFNEVGSMLDKDWVRAFLQSDCLFEPGAEFCYNSMNSYLLSAILCKRTGMGLMQYLTPRLFEPLGIRGAYWETCPLGIEKGGWGLYLRPADMAKLGQLYLQHGRWEADGAVRQLVPEEWVRESVTIRIPTRDNDHAGGYGYQLWDFGAKNAYQFNGVFGQYVVVLPERDMVIAITSGSQNLFSDRSSAIVEQYFGDGAPPFSDTPLPNRIRELRLLKNTLEHLYVDPETAPPPPQTGGFFGSLARRLRAYGRPEALSPAAAALNGRTYRVQPGPGTLMPLILQCATNNFCDGISEVSFSFEPGACSITFSDGENLNLVEAGLDGAARTGKIAVNGEVYAVGATARLICDEDDRPVLKLFLSFLETPCTRTIKFIFYEEKLLIRFGEFPNVDAATKMLFGLVGGKGNTIDKMISDAVRSQRARERMSGIMLPRAKGMLVPDKRDDDKKAEP